MNCLSPSILSADYGILKEELMELDRAGAQYVHIDVMDGSFVNNITIGAPVIKSLRKYTDRIFDVHLMIDRPERYIKDFCDAGADIITVHAEATPHLDQCVQMIKDAGLLAGVALCPSTDISEVFWLLEKIDMVLLMTVNPGFGGQELIPYTIEKVKALHEVLKKRGLKTDIEVDGGVNLSNVRDLIYAGANIIVAGSAVFNGNVSDNTEAFLRYLNEADL